MSVENTTPAPGAESPFELPANRRFVGEVDLPESTFPISYSNARAILTIGTGEEPLLKESRRRFVLFPIQYDEVSMVF